MEKIQITSAGIKKALKKHDYKKAIAEFIWNGFDAQATAVNLIYQANEIGAISELKIVDNGIGIPKDKLADKFTPVFESDKALDPDIQRNTSATHGKNGVGRLTFFTFANEASWNTTYQADGLTVNYSIHIDANTLNSYDSSVPKPSTEAPGTTVSFFGFKTISEYSFKSEIRDYLIREFCWYLELNSRKSYVILINGVPLDYTKNVGDRELFHFGGGPFSFEIDYLRWNESLNDEFSRYYYIDAQDEEKFKETTRLNYQSDKFFHSIYIRSAFFNDLKRPIRSNNGDESQTDFLGFKRSEKIFKDLMEYISLFLRNKRKPFLAESTNKLITEFRKEGVFPPHGQSEWDRIRRYELEQSVRSIYQYEPKVFANLNIEQKKVITRFLDLIIDTDEKARLIDIIAEIINLTKEERAEFAKILQTSRMSSIIKTIRLIEDRYRAIDQLKQLVFDRTLKANEIDHVQKFIEQHYWIFGEQYHLVTAAEPKFEEALRRYIYLLRGEETSPTIDHPDKQKEMDIFMVRQLVQHDKISCVVAELKSPTILLGEKELSQVKKYWGVIRSQPEFNAPNNTWEFYLVGNKFDTSRYLEGEIESAKGHGERSLVYLTSNCKIYVKTWSEIFNEFEIRHKFLLDKLDPDRAILHTPATSANGVVADASNNSAALPSQLTIPVN